ncbi:hypothetical protein KCU81_g366, partial [Aureobasidium melanogenum]
MIADQQGGPLSLGCVSSRGVHIMSNRMGGITLRARQPPTARRAGRKAQKSEKRCSEGNPQPLLSRDWLI